MSIFSFVKEAGEKLINLLTPGNANAGEELKKHVQEVGLGNPNITATVDGDKVTVSGEVATQEEKEKIILAAGNIEGVASVEDQITVTGPGRCGFAFCGGEKGRHPERNFAAGVRQRQSVQQDFRSQQTVAQGPEQNLSGPDAAYS